MGNTLPCTVTVLFYIWKERKVLWGANKNLWYFPCTTHNQGYSIIFSKYYLTFFGCCMDDMLPYHFLLPCSTLCGFSVTSIHINSFKQWTNQMLEVFLRYSRLFRCNLLKSYSARSHFDVFVCCHLVLKDHGNKTDSQIFLL